MTQYPIGHISDYYKMFGIKHGMEEQDLDALLSADNLSFDEVDIMIPGRFMWITRCFHDNEILLEYLPLSLVFSSEL